MKIVVKNSKLIFANISNEKLVWTGNLQSEGSAENRVSAMVTDMTEGIIRNGWVGCWKEGQKYLIRVKFTSGAFHDLSLEVRNGTKDIAGGKKIIPYSQDNVWYEIEATSNEELTSKSNSKLYFSGLSATVNYTVDIEIYINRDNGEYM